MRKSAVTMLALIVVLGLATVGCSRRSDQDISTDLKAKMFSDPILRATNLNAAVKNGEVTLQGEVPSDSARLAAYKLAAAIPGVTKVNDQMTVQVANAAPEDTPATNPEPPPASEPVHKSLRHRDAKTLPADSGNSTGASQQQTTTPPPPPPPAEQQETTPPPPPPPEPRKFEIEQGTDMTVRMIDSVDSEQNHAGEIFKASLDTPITDGNEVVVPAGTDIFVKLVAARQAGKITGRSELHLELVRMDFQGQSYVLQSSTYEQVGASRGKRSAETIGGGAVLGTLIGAIAGGGKGAAIGGVIGAGGGTAVQVATKGQQIKIPSETKLDFKLEQPVEVSYFPDQNKTQRRRKP